MYFFLFSVAFYSTIKKCRLIIILKNLGKKLGKILITWNPKHWDSLRWRALTDGYTPNLPVPYSNTVW